MLTHHAATILGDVPSEWDFDLLCNFLEKQQGGDWGDDEGEAAINVLRSTNFTNDGPLDFADVALRFFKNDKAQTFGLKENDLLLERSGGGPSQPVGRIGFVQRDLPEYWFSNFVQLLRPDRGKIDPVFLGWVLLRLNQSGVIERLQHQTTQMRNLDYRDYLRIYLPKPSPTEQKTISSILNLANEALVIARVKLTAAQRLKTALLQQLFTRGIPGQHSRYKPARVFRHNFEVPDTWDVSPLRHSVTSVEYGTNAPSNDDKHGYPIIAIPEVVASRFKLGECSHAEVPDAEADTLRLEPDDVLLVRTNGNADYIGKSTVIGPEAADQHIIYASYLIRIRTIKDKLSGGYLNYFLSSPLGRRLCLAMANTSAGNHNLGSRAIRQFLLPRPSPDEQETIVDLLDSAEDSIDAVLREIYALQRLKRSLLQNLLTGKVRVKPLETSP